MAVDAEPITPFTETGGPLLLTPRVHGDARGFFFEAYNRAAFGSATGLDVEFVQDNHSRSQQGVLRGLHYQVAPHVQGKLVRVVRGSVFDVAVDIRLSSSTFGRWAGVELTEENHRQLWIPPGFAHGFCVTSESADLVYKTTDFYAPECDRAIRFDDPAIGITWPLGTEPVISDKDRKAPALADAEVFG